jgi:hypothetical protein
MSSTKVPTVQDLLENCYHSPGRCVWKGFNVSVELLGDILSEAYDETMPEWPTLIEISDFLY